MIKVGDEVEYTGNEYRVGPRRFVVTEVNTTMGRTFLSGFGPHGDQYALKSPNFWRPTGRHFPQVEELLNAMKEAGM